MRVLPGLVLAVSVFAAAPAMAQQQKAPDKADVTTAEARLRFNEGIKLAEEGNHEAARLKFGQAWALLKSPGIVYNLARSEQLSNHLVEALEHYRTFLKMAADPKVTDQQKQRAMENVSELSNKVGQVNVDAPPSAKIAIDGKAVEWTGVGDPIPVLPGSHEVSATLPDGQTKQVTVECTAGTVTKAALHDVGTPVTPPVAPLPPIEPPKEEAKSSWSAGRIAGLAIAGGGVVALGVGAVFHFKSTGAGNDAEDAIAKNNLGRSGCNEKVSPRPAVCNGIASSRDDQDSSAVIRNALFIGGGALVVGGAALFLLSGPSSKEKARAWHVVPTVSPSASGLAVFGAF